MVRAECSGWNISLECSNWNILCLQRHMYCNVCTIALSQTGYEGYGQARFMSLRTSEDLMGEQASFEGRNMHFGGDGERQRVPPLRRPLRLRSGSGSGRNDKIVSRRFRSGSGWNDKDLWNRCRYRLLALRLMGRGRIRSCRPASAGGFRP